MPENYRALVAILVLSIPALWYLRKPLTASAIAPNDYQLRAGLWLGLTVVLFLAHSFWLFVFVAALALLTVGRKDSNPLGLYFFLLLLAPPFQAPIQGFGGINHFLAVDYLRLLSLVVLLPTALHLSGRPGAPGLFRMPTDKYLLGYLGLLLVIQAPLTSTTDLMRSIVSAVIDTFLPYYVFSRGISDVRRLRDTFAAFTAGCSVVAVIAIFESLKGWLLYSSLPNVLDVVWGYGHYMVRDGALRASASTGHSIILGYVLTVALGLHLTLRSVYPTAATWRAVLVLLGAGIAASVARGPWVGAAALIAVAVALGPGAGGRIGKIGIAAIFVVPALMMTPMGDKIISLLPFVGTMDAGSVDYRQRLFDVSWDVLMQNPFFGSPYYMATAAMEQMRQGEGIIDMVNSYLGVAMVSGFVGLALFVGVFASSAGRLWLHLGRHRAKGGEDYITGRSLLATLVGVLVIIATASSINAIPVVYWCLAGACAAYLRLVREARYEAPQASIKAATGLRRAAPY